MTTETELKAELKQLMEDKTKLERELNDLSELEQLENEQSGDSSTADSTGRFHNRDLIDAQGFPRADRDVYAVAHRRHRIAVLSNDHKAIMKSIDSKLQQLHAVAKQNKAAAAATAASTQPTAATATTSAAAASGIPSERTGSARATVPSNPTVAPLVSRYSILNNTAAPAPPVPFFLVDIVELDSPAYVAGLKVGDKVHRFGSVDKSNHERDSIPTVVRSSVGRPITVLVERDSEVITVQLVPQTWSGKGLLGCHLTPI